MKISHASESLREKIMSGKKERQSNFFDVCSSCGGKCCRDAKPPISSKRRKIIGKYLAKRKIRINNPFAKTAYVFPKGDAEGYCIFYDRKSGKCLIHHVKPETCVAGPVTFDINSKSQKIEWFLKEEKICSLAGILHKDSGAFERHLGLAKKEIHRLLRELDPEALKAILKIEEPETFKIGEDGLEAIICDRLGGS